MDTIAALATPPQVAALALLRVSGPLVARWATELWPTQPLRPRRASVRRWMSRAGVLLDEVVVTFWPAPHSYTSEDVLEISCHGSPWLAQAILHDLWQRGARPALPGEFTRRAVMHGRMDLTQAEAVAAVIAAESEAAAVAAQRLLRGELGHRLVAWSDALLQAIAEAEAFLDFPEEDIGEEDQQARRQAVAALAEALEQMVAAQPALSRALSCPRVVLAGPPNSGKSSLLNRLLGFNRALVSALPGTTRDYLEADWTVGGQRLSLVDTAGLRLTTDATEQAGQEHTQTLLTEADVILWLSPLGEPVSPPPPLSRPDQRVLCLASLADVAPERQAPAGWRRLSVLTDEGLPGLREELAAVATARTTLAQSEALLLSARQREGLALAIDHLKAALDCAQAPTLDRFADELRAARGALEELLGRVDNEVVLDKLFATFCIGK